MTYPVEDARGPTVPWWLHRLRRRAPLWFILACFAAEFVACLSFGG